MICNDTYNIDKNLFDRCSRIRYYKEYKADSNSVFIRSMAEDKGVKNIDEVVTFITEKMKIKSFDNISSFLDEIVLFEDITLEEIAEVMNISLTKE